MFYLDTSEEFNNIDVAIGDPGAAATFPNEGAKERFDCTSFSRSFEILGRIHHELFSQPKLLLNKSVLRIKLQRHDPKFYLMARKEGGNFNMKIDQAIFYVCKKDVAPSIRLEHEKLLLTNNAKYYMRRAECRFYTRSAGRADLSEPNLYTGVLPRRVIVGLVNSTAFEGSYEHNPLEFKNYNVSSVALRENGTTVSYEEIEADFEGDNYYKAYAGFLQGCNILFDNKSNGITPEMYKHGYTLHVFNLAADGEDTELTLLREGKLSLNIKLDKTTNEPVTVLYYMEFDSVLEITSDRRVLYLEEN